VSGEFVFEGVGDVFGPFFECVVGGGDGVHLF